RLDSHLLIPTRHGITALIHYELGHYKDASHYWRLHYALSYDASLIDSLKRMLSDQIKQNPEDIEYYLSLADLYFNTGNYSDSSKMYLTALEKHKNNYDAKIGLATSLAMQGEYKQSQAVFTDLLRHDYKAKNITSFLNILVAVDKLEESIKLENGDIYLTLAFAYRYLCITDLRKQKDCVYLADKAISINDRLDGAFFCKGIIYLKQEQYDQALKEFLRVVEINPSYADVYYRMGYIYGIQGDLEKELSSYKIAVDLGGKDPTYAYYLGTVLLNKYDDVKQANSYFKKAYEMNPANHQALSMYGSTMLLINDYGTTLNLCNTMIKKYPSWPYWYKLKADCYYRMNNYEDAVKFYLMSRDVSTKSGTSSPLDNKAFIDLAEAYIQLNKLDDAIISYRNALKIKPYDVDTLFALQVLYRRVSRYEEAYLIVKEILRIQPDHSGAQRILPYLKRNTGR
ncbi:MAG TPA: tetratricopeptide repeat protein, partial [Candidatus Sulfobium mesophilum]|nr:tetratricopeptide repeat protein [Candidatus Sulfobium mesophilum]